MNTMKKYSKRTKKKYDFDIVPAFVSQLET